jgi:phosphate uptake regulator
MDPLHLSQHISRQFNSEIEDVRRQVLAMGGLVEEQIAASLAELGTLARGQLRGSLDAPCAICHLPILLTHTAR